MSSSTLNHQKPENPVPKSDTEKIQVLVAEDNLTYRTLASSLLRKWGCAITLVGDGSAAVEAISARSFDVVLMDLEMPQMDGTTATRLIREQEKTTGRRTPIIAMTASSIESDHEKCRQAGMDGCLSKASSAKELFDGIQRLAGIRLREPSPALQIESTKAVPETSIPASKGYSYGGQELELEVAEAFLEEGPELVERALRVVQQAGSELAGVAHALKGAAAQVGGTAVVELASVLETLGRRGYLERAQPILEQLAREMERLTAVLRTLRGS